MNRQGRYIVVGLGVLIIIGVAIFGITKATKSKSDITKRGDEQPSFNMNRDKTDNNSLYQYTANDSGIKNTQKRP